MQFTLWRTRTWVEASQNHGPVHIPIPFYSTRHVLLPNHLLTVSSTPSVRKVLAWPAQHFQQLKIILRGRRSTWSTLWFFCVASAAFSAAKNHFAWQAQHLKHVMIKKWHAAVGKHCRGTSKCLQSCWGLEKLVLVSWKCHAVAWHHRLYEIWRQACQWFGFAFRLCHACTAKIHTGGSACSSLPVRLDHLFFTCRFCLQCFVPLPSAVFSYVQTPNKPY